MDKTRLGITVFSVSLLVFYYGPVGTFYIIGALFMCHILNHCVNEQEDETFVVAITPKRRGYYYNSPVIRARYRSEN